MGRNGDPGAFAAVGARGHGEGGDRPPSRGRRVVVVDDDAGVRSVLRELLADEGYEVEERASPPDLDELLVLRPDLLVLDLVIGAHDDGVAYLRSLHDDPEASWLPVVVCSASERLVEHALDGLVPRQGGVVLKPFRADALLATVATALGHDG